MKTKARSKRVRLILNGKVAGNDALRAAVSRQRADGHRIEVRVTWEKGDARRFVSEPDTVDLVIAAGGDGTLNEVVHGLMDLSKPARPILGIVPLGTANDFATGCGIPRDPAKALALCVRGEAVPIDIGKANDHWFINAASSGFGAEITATTSPELKRLFGPAAYTVMGAILGINLHHYQGRLTMPNREITGSGPVAIVGNGRQTGGGIQVAPRARSTTVCSMCLSFVRSRRQRCWRRRENCNSFQPMASISPIGKRPGWRCILKKQFQLTWMGNRYAFRRSDMKPYQRRFR